MILNIPFIADWEAIRLHKKKIIYKNNQLENKNRKMHTYRIRENVLVRKKKSNKYEEPYVRPYPITQIWTNGKVTIRRGTVKKHIKFRWIKPYNE